MNQNAHNIYIHVPFCRSKCKYCAFFSHPCVEPDWDGYAERICTEIAYWGQKLGRILVPTVFFGGGTPSLVPQVNMARIITTLRKHFIIPDNAEISLEANPATIDKDKLYALQHLGFSRLSVGVQRLDDKELQFLGRIHTSVEAIELLDIAMGLNMHVSGDFIYGIPGDTVANVINICKKINSIGLRHCSLYELTIEKDSVFGKMNLDMPSNEEMADMYQAISQHLCLPRYEVSNYATSGDHCHHNQNVWDGEPYIGIGQGAAGRVLLDGIWYEQSGNFALFEPLSTKARAIEKILTGMRTVRGCQLTQDVKNVIDIDWVTAHPQYVQISDGRISATASGLLILDSIITNMVE